MGWLFLICLIIFIVVYLVAGITLAVRVKTLADCDRHEHVSDNEMGLIVFMWLPLGFVHIWKKGTEGI